MLSFTTRHNGRFAAFALAAALCTTVLASDVPVCDAYAGTISTDTTQQCLVNGAATLVAVPGGDAVVPAGFQIGYVLTRTNGLVIEQVSTQPVFTVTTVDAWRIHTLVYDPSTLDLSSILDLDHAYQLQDLLTQGGGAICASFGMSGAFTKTTVCEEEPCTADAGSISALQPDLCLVDGEAQLEALPDGNATIPDGFSVIHLLCVIPGMLILNAGPEPSFTLTTTGPFSISTLVYDPATFDPSSIEFGVTTGDDLSALFLQGGGSICGSFDPIGAEFFVADCNPVCSAFAGTLSADSADVCLVDGLATLSPTPNGDAVIPDGFTVAYLLTQGAGLVIQNVEPGPVFEWPLTGEYTIHTLVYDPFTINPYEVQLGVTTAFEINEVLIQGGGPICGSLDLDGAHFTIIQCVVPCTADAGTLSADQPDLCLTDGAATLTATPSGDAVVPAGYNVLYLLAVLPDPLVINTAELPSFTVQFPGPIAILTLVYDPATFDPSTIEPGVTNATDLNALFLGGGGELCGSVDLVGAEFFVSDCTPTCEAFAGTLTAEEPEVCLVDGLAELNAVPNGDANVPDGFSVAYLLTQGPDLIIQNVEPGPVFDWPLIGEYTIHTLVYDPFTIDPFQVQLGITSALEINAILIQGGGPICGSLDLDGAQFTIIQCAPPCEAYAGVGGDVLICFNAPVTDLFTLLTDDPDAGGSWTDPNGGPFGGLFDPATDAPGVYVYFVTDGLDCPGDTTQLNVDLIECGGGEQFVMVMAPQERGDLGTNGSTTTAVQENDANTPMLLWPNPATDQVSMELPIRSSTHTRIELRDAIGRAIDAPVTFTGTTLRMDVKALAPGSYTLRVIDGDRQYSGRFMRAAN